LVTSAKNLSPTFFPLAKAQWLSVQIRLLCHLFAALFERCVFFVRAKEFCFGSASIFSSEVSLSTVHPTPSLTLFDGF
jgi:hypothetical protein